MLVFSFVIFLLLFCVFFVFVLLLGPSFFGICDILCLYFSLFDFRVVLHVCVCSFLCFCFFSIIYVYFVFQFSLLFSVFCFFLKITIDNNNNKNLKLLHGYERHNLLKYNVWYFVYLFYFLLFFLSMVVFVCIWVNGLQKQITCVLLT